MNQLFNLRAVGRLVHQPRARRETLPHLMMQARPRLHARLQRLRAMANGKQHARNVQHLAHGGRAHIGAEVPRAVLDLLAPKLHRRERLAQVDADERVVLVVLQKNVVPRHVLLDQVALQNQRFQLAVHQHDVEIVHLFHHRAHLGRVVGGGVKVLPHAVFQVLRLAYVDNLALALHQIAAGRIGQAADFEFQLRGHSFRSFLN